MWQVNRLSLALESARAEARTLSAELDGSQRERRALEAALEAAQREAADAVAGYRDIQGRFQEWVSGPAPVACLCCLGCLRE